MLACYRNIFKAQKTHLQLANHISEGNLFPSTFKVRGNKVLSDFQNFASKCQFYDFFSLAAWKAGPKSTACPAPERAKAYNGNKG